MAGRQTGGGAALARRGVLTMPKLLDVATLYGADNPVLTQQLVTQVRICDVSVQRSISAADVATCSSVVRSRTVLLPCCSRSDDLPAP